MNGQMARWDGLIILVTGVQSTQKKIVSPGGSSIVTIIHPLDHFHRRFLNSIDILYKGYVFHGQYQVLDREPKGFNTMSADVSSALMGLYRVGVITYKRFVPSHSGAALLGLEVSQRRPHLKPHIGDAFHWEWEVLLGDFTSPITTPTKGTQS